MSSVWVTWLLAPDPTPGTTEDPGFMTGCLILQAGPEERPGPTLRVREGVWEDCGTILFTTGSKAALLSRSLTSSAGHWAISEQGSLRPETGSARSPVKPDSATHPQRQSHSKKQEKALFNVGTLGRRTNKEAHWLSNLSPGSRHEVEV